MSKTASHLDGKKKILVGAAVNNHAYLTELTGKHIENCVFYLASDGMEALTKLNNDTPHIVILEKDLAKKDAIQITETILAQKKFEKTAIVIISSPPDKDHFVDEVVTGRVQFTENFEDHLDKYLMRALNFISHGDNSEFRLSYISDGETLMKQGEAAKFVYILKKGSLQAVIEKEGQNQVLGTIAPGEFVGEMAYINGEPRSASVTALSNCELIEIPVDKLDTILFQKPAWSKALIKTLSRRVLKANEKAKK